MPPMFGSPNYDFPEQFDESDNVPNGNKVEDQNPGLTEMAFWYMVILVGMLLLWLLIFILLRIISLRQKTRNPQPRRTYVGTRARQSLGHQEPTIFVSPSNLPPPPKYECMAPPSYEEVVGIHYPNYQIQPISTPIQVALSAHQSGSTTQPETTANDNDNVANSSTATVANDTNETTDHSTVTVTVTDEPRRTSVTVARS